MVVCTPLAGIYAAAAAAAATGASTTNALTEQLQRRRLEARRALLAARVVGVVARVQFCAVQLPPVAELLRVLLPQVRRRCGGGDPDAPERVLRATHGTHSALWLSS